MREKRIEIAADYLVMAAWLAYLKSRLMVPQAASDDEPSGEMMAALLQFRLKRLEAMRQAASRLMNRPRLGLLVYARGMPEPITIHRRHLWEASLYDLLKAYATNRERTVPTDYTPFTRTVWSLNEAREILKRLVGDSADWVPMQTYLVGLPHDPRGPRHRHGLDLRLEPRTRPSGPRRAPPEPSLRPALRAPPSGSAAAMSTLAKILEDMPEPTADKETAPVASADPNEPETDESDADAKALEAFASDPSPEEQAAVADRQLRILEALLFASSEPLASSAFTPFMGEGADVEGLLTLLAERYAGRGVNLVRRGDKWAFRTADDLGFLLRREQQETRNLSRAALETLSIIAYHQPATRAEIEEVRGVATGKGTIDMLMEAGWVRMRGRRRTPGRPVTYGTTEAFLDHFGLECLGDLPGLEELKGAGLLSGRLPASMQIPLPFDGPLREDEDPLEDGDTAETLGEDE